MYSLSLNGSWKMTCRDGGSWDAVVPGTVLQTLLENHAVPDPFDGMNERDACRKMDSVYSFERDFTLSGEILQQPRIELVFEGIDTLADIELNGRFLAHTDNMHRTWRLDIRDIAVPGRNRLKLTFFPAVAYVRKAADENPDVTYPGGSSLLWTGSLRKAHYMFGWDWGPMLPDAGIWRNVRIEAYAFRLEEVRIHQEHTEGRVLLSVAAVTGAAGYSVELADPQGKVIGKQNGGAGESAVFRIDSPRLWWPNGIGDQPLYTLVVRTSGDPGAGDERTMRIGLRTLTVSTDPDEWGSEFAFRCNGVRFFAMGADYIPEDNLLARMTRAKTEKLLRDCKNANFNCVRVWGGGVYPNEDFLDLCDEMGLVVWMDLMFACNTYKMADSFRDSIIRETEDNLRRVRHRACLGLVCGNNEMETGWMDWEDVRCQPDSLKAQYVEQFEVVLKQVCGLEAPDVFYWPSSPSSGGGFDCPNDLNRGDVHDWSVWHGRKPFSDYTRRFPRFCSEFGFESFPCMDTLKSFIHREQDMNPFSEVMEAHQKCAGGNGTMLFYLSQTLKYPFTMEQLVHSTQFLQAEAMKAGVEHWRRNRGRCMGAIYWQLNDCWPVASWAGIDSFGRWKALHYYARRFFAPVLVSLAREEGGYGIFVSNETRNDFRGLAVWSVRDANGSVLRTASVPCECQAMSSARICSVSRNRDEAMPVVRCLLLDEQGRRISENEAIDTLPKHFPFGPAGLRVRQEGNRMAVTAESFCLGVELQAGGARFSDNWFSMYPGEERVVTADRPVDPRNLEIRCLSSQ